MYYYLVFSGRASKGKESDKNETRVKETQIKKTNSRGNNDGSSNVMRGQQDDDGWEFLATRPSGTAPIYTRITQNIAGIVRQLHPSHEELQRRHQVLEAVSQAVRDSFPEYRGIAKVPPLASKHST